MRTDNTCTTVISYTQQSNDGLATQDKTSAKVIKSRYFLRFTEMSTFLSRKGPFSLAQMSCQSTKMSCARVLGYSVLPEAN